MRPLGRSLSIAACALVVSVAAHIARGEGSLGISEIRLTSVEEEATEGTAKVQSSFAFTADEQALPAAPAAAPPAQPKLVNRPVKSPTFRRANSMPSRGQIEPPVATSQMRQALNFYGGSQARVTLSQFPSRTPIQTSPQRPTQRQRKPFHTIYRDPTVSPYMNLYREESDSEGAPNYFAFVRPELEQIEANRSANHEIQQLSRQIPNRSRTMKQPQPQYQPASTPGRSTPARYMDTAQFYGGWSR